MQNSKPTVVCAPSRLKTVTKHKTKDFAELHNQILLLIMRKQKKNNVLQYLQKDPIFLVCGKTCLVKQTYTPFTPTKTSLIKLCLIKLYLTKHV